MKGIDWSSPDIDWSRPSLDIGMSMGVSRKRVEMVRKQLGKPSLPHRSPWGRFSVRVSKAMQNRRYYRKNAEELKRKRVLK